MNYQEFQDARQLLAEEGLGVHVRASQLAQQEEDDATAKATAEEFRRRGLVAPPPEPANVNAIAGESGPYRDDALVPQRGVS